MKVLALVLIVAVSACGRSEKKTDVPAPAESSAPIAKESAAKPSPSAAPKFARYKSSDYLRVMKKIDTKIGAKDPKNSLTRIDGEHPMTKDDYGMAPMLADEATYFLVPSLGPEKGGRIMSFSNPDDLATTKAYYDDLKKTSAALFSWTATKGNLLLQVNGDMPEKHFKLFVSGLEMIDIAPKD